ncbi:MAG: hypothetical protein AMXMBFR64_54160 [Myxococcales bacterium]
MRVLALLLLTGCTTVNTGGSAVCLGQVVNGVCVAGGLDAAGDDVASYDGRPCTNNLQCGDLACIGGFCSVQCKDDKDCPGAQVCHKLVCADPQGDTGQDAAVALDAGPGATEDEGLPDGGQPDAGTPPKKCSQHVDCAPAGACVGGWCTKECDEDWECGDEPGWECTNFLCLFSDPFAPDTGPDVKPPVDTGPDVKPQTDTGPPPKSGYGVPCGSKEECQSGLCVQNQATGGGTCTMLCGKPSDCPGKDACIVVQQGTNICYPSDSGKSCPAPPSACVAGLSLSNPKGACVCTVECETAADCQTSAACSQWQVGGSTMKLCTPIGLPCKVSGTNPKGDVCHQLCYPITATSGACSAQCATSLDCPAGYKCFTETLPGGGVLKTCQPS